MYVSSPKLTVRYFVWSVITVSNVFKVLLWNRFVCCPEKVFLERIVRGMNVKHVEGRSPILMGDRDKQV